jgi:hypothetical protein
MHNFHSLLSYSIFMHMIVSAAGHYVRCSNWFINTDLNVCGIFSKEIEITLQTTENTLEFDV